MSLTPAQIDVLLRPIKPGRVATREGLSNVEAYDIRAHLTRVFGFANWSLTNVEPAVMLYEQETTTRAGKPAFKVAYRATVCLSISDIDSVHLASYVGSAVGESIMPDFKRGDAHDMALKTAESQAMKRAAINLGDQFGLSLYQKGNTGPLVGALVVTNRTTMGEQFPVELHEPDVTEEVHDVAGAVEPVTESVVSAPTEMLFEPDVEQNTPIPVDPDPPSDDPLVSDSQIRKIQILMGEHNIKDRERKLAYINDALTLNISSSKELTRNEAHHLIDQMEKTRP